MVLTFKPTSTPSVQPSSSPSSIPTSTPTISQETIMMLEYQKLYQNFTQGVDEISDEVLL